MRAKNIVYRRMIKLTCKCCLSLCDHMKKYYNFLKIKLTQVNNIFKARIVFKYIKKILTYILNSCWKKTNYGSFFL